MDHLITPRSTFFMKFIFPALWLGFLVAWTYGVYHDPKKKLDSDNPWFVLFPLAMVLGGIYYFVRYHLPLKKVWIVDGGLRVSNYRKETILPFGAIESVTQKWEINLRYIIVQLREDSIFGRRFTFLPARPKKAWPMGSGEDSIVLELRKLIKSNRSNEVSLE